MVWRNKTNHYLVKLPGRGQVRWEKPRSWGGPRHSKAVGATQRAEQGTKGMSFLSHQCVLTTRGNWSRGTQKHTWGRTGPLQALPRAVSKTKITPWGRD